MTSYCSGFTRADVPTERQARKLERTTLLQHLTFSHQYKHLHLLTQNSWSDRLITISRLLDYETTFGNSKSKYNGGTYVRYALLRLLLTFPLFRSP